MRRLEYQTQAFELANAAATLGLPPTTYATVSEWNNPGIGCVPEFELEIWASEALDLTNTVLYGARLHTQVIADVVLTSVNGTTNILTKNGHGLLVADGPLQWTTTGAPPTDVELLTDYWVIPVNANTFKLATSFENALLGTALDFTGNGTGTVTLVDTADTQRVHWQTHHGLLGLAGDGAISLTAQLGYSKRVPHSPRVFAYALAGTLSTGTVNAALFPIQGR